MSSKKVSKLNGNHPIYREFTINLTDSNLDYQQINLNKPLDWSGILSTGEIPLLNSEETFDFTTVPDEIEIDGKILNKPGYTIFIIDQKIILNDFIFGQEFKPILVVFKWYKNSQTISRTKHIIDITRELYWGKSTYD